ncbi:MAG: acyl-CoA thioesterase [Desulfurococcales archaeon]|jgi:acyl-CoA thioester hydrolase|nr:acyl-CoA thioesterase [Desulfurococcales archaeon]
MSRKNVFVYRFYIPFVDTDAAGVVHFTNYLRYVERAEEEMFRSEDLSYKDVNTKGIWLPRVEAFIRFLRPLRHTDLAEINLWVSDYGEKHVKYCFEIKNLTTNELAAKGHLTIVCAEIGGRATKCPEIMIKKILKYYSEETCE